MASQKDQGFAAVMSLVIPGEPTGNIRVSCANLYDRGERRGAMGPRKRAASWG